jgi:DNA-binding NtrC family response regulator
LNFRSRRDDAIAGTLEKEPLAGLRILIVEDELLVAMDLEECLKEAGAEITATVPSVEKAMAALDAERPDAVSLDMNLAGTSSEPIAAALGEAGIPFVLISGYGSLVDQTAPFRKAASSLTKPYDLVKLVAAFERVARERRGH